jgi:hypothetical protein
VQLGLRIPCHAVLRLEHERWYIGMVILEGGVGSLLGVEELLDVGAVAPRVYFLLSTS